MEVAIYLIDQLPAYIHGQIEPEKGQTSEPLASLLSGRKFKYPKLRATTGLLYFPSGAFLCDTSTQDCPAYSVQL